MSGKQPKSSNEKPHHLFRLPSQFGLRLRTSAFSSSPDPYWTRLANKTHQILAQKYKTGQLKQPTVRRAKIPKVAYLLILLLVVALPSAIIYAQYSGQFTATTTMRSPLSVRLTQFQLPDLWMNTTASTIVDNAFVVNTGGRSLTYTFRVWASTTINGTLTQDMIPLFTQFQITFSDYSRNVTVASLLSPTQTVSFIYSSTSDVQFRVILSYSSRAVQLGSTSTPLTVFFIYAYSE